MLTTFPWKILLSTKLFVNKVTLSSTLKFKDTVVYIHNVIYKGECSCKEKYVDEAKRNATTKWAEHKVTNGTSEPAKHISTNPSHEFEWKVLSRAPDDWRKRRILKAFFIKMLNSSINDHRDIKNLCLFRNGIT